MLRSARGRALEADTLHVPPPAALHSPSELDNLPHAIGAGEAFPLKPYLLENTSQKTNPSLTILCPGHGAYQNMPLASAASVDGFTTAECSSCQIQLTAWSRPPTFSLIICTMMGTIETQRQMGRTERMGRRGSFAISHTCEASAGQWMSCTFKTPST